LIRATRGVFADQERQPAHELERSLDMDAASLRVACSHDAALVNDRHRAQYGHESRRHSVSLEAISRDDFARAVSTHDA
jgi:hypothetical protein